MDPNQQQHVIYFASDFHLGVPSLEESRNREKKLVNWLSMAAEDATEIFLVGDLFDFWFEYKFTIPKGFVRFLGKIAEIVESGITVYIFTGNHDMWMFDYLEKETGVKILRSPQEFVYNEKQFFIGHGDGLGPGDYSYKLIKKIFSNPLCQWLFERVHPNLSFKIANYWSRKSRENDSQPTSFLQQKEWLVQYAKQLLKNKHYDFFIFGHRHLPVEYQISEKSKYINLGDWIKHNSYAKFEGGKIQLLEFN